MPTTTSLSNWYFINAGPLTTTFTAPESCSTEIGHTALALFEEERFMLAYQFDCDSEGNGDCIPEGESIDSLFQSLSTQRPDPTYQAFIYHSPGLHCPSGWATVGKAERDADGQITSSGPAYEAHLIKLETVTTSVAPQVIPPAQVFAEALDNEETVVLCCPSGNDIYPGGAFCYSTLETQVESTEVCNVYGTDGLSIAPETFTYEDETLTGMQVYDHGPTRAFETRYETLFPSDAAEQGFIPITQAPMVTLVYKEQGDESPDDDDDNDNDGDDNGGGSNGGGSNGGDGEDAAINWSATGVITGVLGVAALAGAVLL